MDRGLLVNKPPLRRGFIFVRPVEKLRAYLLGWKAYFGLAQTPCTDRRGLDERPGHCLRAIQLKQEAAKTQPLSGRSPDTRTRYMFP